MQVMALNEVEDHILRPQESPQRALKSQKTAETFQKELEKLQLQLDEERIKNELIIQAYTEEMLQKQAAKQKHISRLHEHLVLAKQEAATAKNNLEDREEELRHLRKEVDSYQTGAQAGVTLLETKETEIKDLHKKFNASQQNCTQALKLVEDKDKEIERISDLYKKCIRDYENAMMLVAQREHWQKQTEGKYQDLVQHMTLERSSHQAKATELQLNYDHSQAAIHTLRMQLSQVVTERDGLREAILQAQGEKEEMYVICKDLLDQLEQTEQELSNSRGHYYNTSSDRLAMNENIPGNIDEFIVPLKTSALKIPTFPNGSRPTGRPRSATHRRVESLRNHGISFNGSELTPGVFPDDSQNSACKSGCTIM